MNEGEHMVEESKNPKIIGVVRIRGRRNMKPKIKYTLGLLRLYRPNHCVFYPESPALNGMLQVVKDYVAYGPVSDYVVSSVISKRGEKGSIKLRKLKDNESKKMVSKYVSGLKSGMGPNKLKDVLDPVFRLRPPRRGYKNIKKHYPYGPLGRWNSLDDLLKRMV